MIDEEIRHKDNSTGS